MNQTSFICQLLPKLHAVDLWTCVRSSLLAANELLDEYRVTIANDLSKNGAGQTKIIPTERIAEELSVFPTSKSLLFRENSSPRDRAKFRFSYAGSVGFLTISAKSSVSRHHFELVENLAQKEVLVNALRRSPDYSKKFVSTATTKSQRSVTHTTAPLVETPLDLIKYPGAHHRTSNQVIGVSADMWLGENFWQHASCTKEDVLNADWLEVEKHPNHIYVKAWPHPFDSNEGEQREVQLKLLKLLFDIKEH
ncbi:hypothetical protein AAFN60_18800 [Roseibacillus persicicus]|uniref:hypothetical protein n=1 Tax=Roseibacillus persicicus TaxID=454148 RepID=UPI00398B9391